MLVCKLWIVRLVEGSEREEENSKSFAHADLVASRVRVACGPSSARTGRASLFGQAAVPQEFG